MPSKYPHSQTRSKMRILHRLFILAALGLGSSTAIAEQQPSSSVVAGKARFTVVTPTLLRIEWQASGTFIDNPSFFAVNREAGCKDYALHRGEGDAVEIDTGRMRLHWKPNGQPFQQDNLKVEIKVDEKWTTWWPRLAPKSNLGGTNRTIDEVAGPVKLEDGLIARDGWAVVDDSGSAIQANGWFADRPPGSGPDWYLFGYGHDYRAALHDLATIGGAIPQPRKYVLGSWYSRYWPYTSKEYRQIVDEYAKNDFPLDVMVMDMDWHRKGWTGWSWNREILPDAEELLKYFHQQGLAVTLNLHPADGVNSKEDRYADFMRAMKEAPESNQTVRFDAGNKAYLDALYQNVMLPLVKDGVDFWWLDWQQTPLTLSIKSLTNLAALNRYYSEATSSDTTRGISFSRWAGWGDHRYPIHFSGDSHIRWEMLAFEIPFTSTAGNAGCFFWSHDIGGHMAGVGRNDELYARWVQFGAMSPALRSHSTRKSELDRRPWTYGKEACESMRQAFHLRSELFPYIYSSVVQSCRDTWPLCRPLYMDWPKEEKAYKNATEYLFGDGLLVAPICAPGEGPAKVASRPVWFPPNSTWYNWFTGERMEGNSERLVAADLNEFPLYARGGVPIPSQSYSPRMTTAPLTNLVVRCWPGADGAVQKSVFYEDDGVSNDYKKGKSASTALVYERKGNRIKITANPVQGTFAGQLQKREMSVELMGLAKPASATLNGKAVDFRYNAANGQVKVRVPERSIHESVVVTVVAEEASQEPMVAAAQKRRMAGVMGHPVEDWKAEMAKPDLTVGQRSALQAIRGYGLAKKNDAPYLFKGTEQFYLFAAKDSVIPSRVTLRMGGKQIGGEINQSVNISSQEPSLIEWPIKIEKTIEFEIPEAGKMQATDL